MDTTFVTQPKAIGPTVSMPEQLRVQDTKVPAIKALDHSATLPADKAFVAQVVTARLSGTQFPENPGEIAPPERTLRPYSVPMLPFDKDEPTVDTDDAVALTEADAQEEASEDTDPQIIAIENEGPAEPFATNELAKMADTSTPAKDPI